MFNNRKKDFSKVRRIEGRIRGIQRMVEKDMACLDILTQVASVTCAIKKVGTIIIRTSIEECLEKSWKGQVFK